MTRTDFISFLKEFKTDFEQNKENWENKTLEDFLESMIAYTEDIQGYYDNMKLNIDANEPTWENFMTILKGASIYE
jgi:hypothetical protein